MTTRPPPPAIPDTFEARWDRWVAEGIRQDQIAHRRAIVTLVILAPTMAIAAVWLLVLR